MTGIELPRVFLPVDFWVESDLEVEPNEVTFGAVQLGTTVADTIVLRSQSGAAYDVVDISVDGLQTMIREVIPERAYQLSVTPSIEGDAIGHLYIRVQQPGSGIGFTLKKRISYYGLAQDLGATD
jgi:hypothetical protein